MGAGRASGGSGGGALAARRIATALGPNSERSSVILLSRAGWVAACLRSFAGHGRDRSIGTGGDVYSVPGLSAAEIGGPLTFAQAVPFDIFRVDQRAVKAGDIEVGDFYVGHVGQ